MNELSALIIDDDEDFRASVAALVAREGYSVREAATLAHARREVESGVPDVVLLDLLLPDGDGLELMSDPMLDGHTEFVVISGHGDMESAISALRDGALDYLTKPIDQARFNTILTNVARTRGLKHEVARLRRELRGLGRFGPMVGRSKPMQEVYHLITRVAATESTVFITGESGSGKELVAETVHQLSRRCNGPFLAINCGAMSPTLIESELFGHEKGSFTGADRRRSGYFEEASGGTLFLDEITEMPIELQVKLLRVLETGQLIRVGATTPTAVDVRVVTASNRDPKEALEEGLLREDLYYRLNVFPIRVPPLRARGSDIELLAQYFLDQVNTRESTSKRLSDGAVRRVHELAWPGNVRELKNVVERASILADDVIWPEMLPGVDPQRPMPDSDAALHVRVGSSIAEVERRLILATLQELHGDKRRASHMLGISLKTLYNRLNVYEAAGNRQ
jgi:DNA-binding NtrC family response regulator